MNTNIKRLYLKRNLEWWLLYLVISIPRIIYVIVNTNSVGDTVVYDELANNLLNGNGFGIFDDSGLFQPLVGGIFPGYPSYLAFLYKLNLGHKGVAIITTLIFSFAALKLAFTVNSVFSSKKYTWITGIVVGLSPLNIGISRFIFIEPLLSAFSVFVISELILLYKKNNTRIRIINLIVLVTCAIYMKPSAVILFAPISIAFLILFGLKRMFIGMTIIIVTVSFFISPWIGRGYVITNNITSSIGYHSYAPAGIKEYQDWVKTWSVSEPEMTAATWPIWAGNIERLKLESGLFLTPENAKQAKKILRNTYDVKNKSFSNDGIKSFIKLKEEQLASYNILNLSSLYFLRVTSYLYNPYQSWGYNSSIREDIEVNSTFTFIMNYIFKLLKLIFKLFIIFYKMILSIVIFLSLKKTITSLKAKTPYSLFEYFSLIVITTLISHLVLLPIHLNVVEHRHLTFVSPWGEMVMILSLIKSRRLLYNNSKIVQSSY